MPTYDYRCGACRHEFELFQSMKDPVKRKCPSCGKNALERLIGTGGAILFKGSGFYETDYRSSSYKKAAEAEGKSSAGEKKSDSGGAGGGEKSTPKPEARPEPKKSGGESAAKPAKST